MFSAKISDTLLGEIITTKDFETFDEAEKYCLYVSKTLRCTRSEIFITKVVDPVVIFLN